MPCRRSCHSSPVVGDSINLISVQKSNYRQKALREHDRRQFFCAFRFLLYSRILILPSIRFNALLGSNLIQIFHFIFLEQRHSLIQFTVEMPN